MFRLISFTALALLAGVGSSHAGELPRATPEAVGLSAAKLAELTPALRKLVDDGKIAGGVASSRATARSPGPRPSAYRDLASKTPMTEDTIFRIASMTKPITCVAAMMLVEQGKLGLDDPVAKYLPELKEMRVLGDAKDDKGDAIATVPASAPDHGPSPARPYLGVRLRHPGRRPAAEAELCPGRRARAIAGSLARREDDRRSSSRARQGRRWCISPASAGPTA